MLAVYSVLNTYRVPGTILGYASYLGFEVKVELSSEERKVFQVERKG